MNIHDGYLFLKVIDGRSQQHSVKSMTSCYSKPPILFKIINKHSENGSRIAQVPILLTLFLHTYLNSIHHGAL